MLSKIRDRDFTDFIWSNNIVRIDYSWLGHEIWNITWYFCFSMGKTRLAKYRRNTGGIIVNVKNYMSGRVREIQSVSGGITWSGVKDRVNSTITDMCSGFACNPPRAFTWFNPDYLRVRDRQVTGNTLNG
jgi:hypothetical protein